jgi:hypothetical protein
MSNVYRYDPATTGLATVEMLPELLKPAVGDHEYEYGAAPPDTIPVKLMLPPEPSQ